MDEKGDEIPIPYWAIGNILADFAASETAALQEQLARMEDANKLQHKTIRALNEEVATFRKDCISLREQLANEQQSHDAEIRRISEKLALAWSCTIEDICKSIEKARERVAELERALQSGLRILPRMIDADCGNCEGTPCNDMRPKFVCNGHKWIAEARRVLAGKEQL